ncbi:MAG: peptidyl-prolyl cis-trans isomerase [Cyclobacteriaceae bacterium]
MKDKPQDEEGEKPIARVYDQFLFAEDLAGITATEMSPEDSTSRAQSFIDSWIRKQLLIHEAAQNIQFNEADIERKILDYRYSLMGYEYQTHYINEHLNTDVSEAEIEAYYEENVDNFLLKQNIIRCKYVKLPITAPRANRISRLLRSNKEEDLEELNSYCLSFANAYQLDDSIWMEFDEVIKNSPMAEIPNKVQFLRNNSYFETEDDEFKYFLKIEEYKISDNISPIEFVKDDIRSIILNKRKVLLAEELEEKVYNEASENEQFEIFAN